MERELSVGDLVDCDDFVHEICYFFVFFIEGSVVGLDVSECGGVTRSFCCSGVGVVLEVWRDVLFVKCIFTVVESCVNMSNLRINALNYMLTDDFVYCEFVIVKFRKTRLSTEVFMAVFLLDLEHNDFFLRYGGCG